ncbi:BRO-N domain-containing protein [Salaquimonas pukyongi]|uniref:BRO-N domain-containing protein n=1 Tax=Salaquimonas pukyongi TaxID=2712698 RepID=UPI00096B779B|nr:BRO family protein [Salaquimonas pukyongi]
MTPVILTFDYLGDVLRIAQIGDEYWFVGKDVCRCLGIRDVDRAMERLSLDERRENIPTSQFRPSESTSIGISELGVYRLIFTCRQPDAERFKRFIFDKVIAPLRSTDGYAQCAPNEEMSFRDKIAAVREARLVRGRRAALDTWKALGLPAAKAGHAGTRTGTDFSNICQFLNERTVPDSAADIWASDLYAVYQRWAKQNELPIVSRNPFGKYVVQSEQVVVRKSGTTKYCGLRVRK